MKDSLVRKWTNEYVLINELRDGNEEAFTFITHEYYGVLCFFCNQKVKDLTVAREIVSDIFYNLWRRKSQLPDIQSLEPYLFSAARNACIDYQRAQKRKRAREASFEIAREATHEENAEDKITPENVQAVYDAIDQLSPQLKQVMSMYLRNIKTTDIAASLEVSPATVRSYKRTAITIMKTILAGKIILFPVFLLPAINTW